MPGAARPGAGRVVLATAVLTLASTIALSPPAGSLRWRALVEPHAFRRRDSPLYVRRPLAPGAELLDHAGQLLLAIRVLVDRDRYPTSLAAGQPSEVPAATPDTRAGGYPPGRVRPRLRRDPGHLRPAPGRLDACGLRRRRPFPDQQPSAIAAQHGVNTEGDLANEPGDLAFVTREILAASATASAACPVVDGLVRADQVALAGHSDGGNAVAMLAYDQGRVPQGATFASLRAGIGYRAVMVFSGDEVTGQSYATEPSRPNLLLVQSRDDQCNPIRYGVQLYDAIHQPNKWFLELQTAHHLPPFDGADVTAFKTVAATTTRFLQISLSGESFSTRLLDFANQLPAVARMSAGAPGPSLANAPTLVEVCGFD